MWSRILLYANIQEPSITSSIRTYVQIRTNTRTHMRTQDKYNNRTAAAFPLLCKSVIASHTQSNPIHELFEYELFRANAPRQCELFSLSIRVRRPAFVVCTYEETSGSRSKQQQLLHAIESARIKSQGCDTRG